MSYYQNPLDAEFQGSLLLSDRQYNVTFRVKGNLPNSSTLFQAWNSAPYDVSTNKALTLNYSFDSGNTWTPLTIADVGVTALDNTAANAYEIAGALTANATFQALFTASVNQDNQGNTYPVVRAIRSREKFKSYVSNGGAEIALRFNKKAGIAELPTYMDRHTIANKAVFPDSLGTLVYINPSTAIGQQIIQEAALSYTFGTTNGSAIGTTTNTMPFAVGDNVVVFDGTTTLSSTISSVSPNASLTLAGNWTGAADNAQLVVVHADYQLLRGRSGMFTFTTSVLGTGGLAGLPLATIEYPAGAQVGDLAMKTTYAYSGTGVTKVCQVPYTLTAADLVTP